MVEEPEYVPKVRQTSCKSYVPRVDSRWLTEPLGGFSTMSLADPSFGSNSAVTLYAGVLPWNSVPGTYVHEFDQYYFLLEVELTIEAAS